MAGSSVASVLVVIGALWLYHTATGARIDAGIAMSGSLVATGALLVLTGGRMARGSLIGLGVVLTIILATTLPGQRMMTPDGAFGDRAERPATVTDLRPSYSQAFGSLTIDLRTVELPSGTTHVEANSSFGSLVVLLPPGRAARVTGRSTFGSIQALGREVSGIGNQLSAQTDDYDAATTRIDLQIETAFGSAEVRR